MLDTRPISSIYLSFHPISFSLRARVVMERLLGFTIGEQTTPLFLPYPIVIVFRNLVMDHRFFSRCVNLKKIKAAEISRG
jgi:hypothetical protein